VKATTGNKINAMQRDDCQYTAAVKCRVTIVDGRGVDRTAVVLMCHISVDCPHNGYGWTLAVNRNYCSLPAFFGFPSARSRHRPTDFRKPYYA